MLNRVKSNPAQLRREPRSSYSISCNRFLEICPVSLKHPSSQSLVSCSWASGQKSKALVSTSASHILFPSWPATGAKWGQARERKKQQGAPVLLGTVLQVMEKGFLPELQVPTQPLWPPPLPSLQGCSRTHTGKQTTKTEFLPLSLTARVPLSTDHKGGPLTELFLSGAQFHVWGCLLAQTVKNLPAMQETWVQSLGQEDTLEKEMATCSSILAWRSPWTKKTGCLQSMGSQRVGHE